MHTLKITSGDDDDDNDDDDIILTTVVTISITNTSSWLPTQSLPLTIGEIKIPSVNRYLRYFVETMIYVNGNYLLS